MKEERKKEEKDSRKNLNENEEEKEESGGRKKRIHYPLAIDLQDQLINHNSNIWCLCYTEVVINYNTRPNI